MSLALEDGEGEALLSSLILDRAETLGREVEIREVVRATAPKTRNTLQGWAGHHLLSTSRVVL